MTNAELLAKIKAEIEKRLALQSLIKGEFAEGSRDALNGFLSFLSTLESEKPFKEPIDGVLYAAACGIKNKGQIEKPEKPLPADLEEASDEYAEKHGFRVPYDGSENFYDDVDVKASKDGFIAGAKWDRSQMLKGAVEYEVGMHGEPIKITIDKYVQRAKGIFPGDKVKIFIVKED